MGDSGAALQYAARNVFQQELAHSLALADRTVVSDVYRAGRYGEAERLRCRCPRSPGWLPMATAPLSFARRRCYCRGDQPPELRAGDVVAILSNGAFGAIYEKLPAALRPGGLRRGTASQSAGRSKKGAWQTLIHWLFMLAFWAV